MFILDWLVIGAYFLVLAIIVIMVRKARTISDFAVGSREIPAAIVFATLSASLIGPGYSMGIANNAAQQGIIWVLIFGAFSLQMTLIGIFVAPRLRKFDKAYTIGDILAYRYGKLVKFISGIISVILLAGFFGVIAKASGDIIHAITGMNFLWAIILSTFVVIAYSTFGGIKSVIITDVIQFIILALAIPITILFMTGGNLQEAVVSIPEEMFSLRGKFPPIVLIGLFASFFFGEMLLPMYATRALVAKGRNEAKNGFVLTGIFSLIWFFLCTVIGILGILAFPESQNPFVSVLKFGLPMGLTGIAVAALFSIIMSSQSSILNAAAVTFNFDVLTTFSRRFRSEEKALRTSKWLNVLIGFLAVFFALNVPSVVEALLICYTLWAPTVVLPLIIAVFSWKVKPIAAFAAIIAGGITTGVWEWGLGNPYEVPSLVIGVVANQLFFWSFHFWVKNPDQNSLFQPVKE
jgi:solute:Na+ symporter, SSS family